MAQSGTSTTLSLSIGATREASPTLSAREENHGGAQECGVIGVDAFEPDLREDRREGREHRGQECPREPVL